jgi:hypothetical protein
MTTEKVVLPKPLPPKMNVCFANAGLGVAAEFRKRPTFLIDMTRPQHDASSARKLRGSGFVRKATAQVNVLRAGELFQAQIMCTHAKR